MTSRFQQSLPRGSTSSNDETSCKAKYGPSGSLRHLHSASVQALGNPRQLLCPGSFNSCPLARTDLIFLRVKTERLLISLQQIQCFDHCLCAYVSRASVCANLRKMTCQLGSCKQPCFSLSLSAVEGCFQSRASSFFFIYRDSKNEDDLQTRKLIVKLVPFAWHSTPIHMIHTFFVAHLS